MKRNPSSVAKQLLKENNLETAPIFLTRVAEIANIPILEVELPDDVSGMLFIEGNKTKIFVKSSDSTNRKRFTIAHELGHYFLNHCKTTHVDKGVNIQATTLLRNSKSAMAIDPLEIEANQFAAELLMPEALVKDFFKKHFGKIKSGEDELFLEEMAKVFRVSSIAMSIRLQNLRLFNWKK